LILLSSASPEGDTVDNTEFKQENCINGDIVDRHRHHIREFFKHNILLTIDLFLSYYFLYQKQAQKKTPLPGVFCFSTAICKLSKDLISSILSFVPFSA